MNSKTIKKTVAINAAREKVWDVLTNDRLTRIWYAAFSEGAHAVTDWRKGSKAVFKDNTGSGLIGTVTENNEHELLSIAYNGILNDGKEDYESKAAEEVKGGKEVYRLIQDNGGTRLEISCDMSEQLFEPMNAMWENAVSQIKQLSESL